MCGKIQREKQTGIVRIFAHKFTSRSLVCLVHNWYQVFFGSSGTRFFFFKWTFKPNNDNKLYKHNTKQYGTSKESLSFEKKPKLERVSTISALHSWFATFEIRSKPCHIQLMRLIESYSDPRFGFGVCLQISHRSM